MTWSDYYEKINDWAVSTAVNKISSLEDMGASDEIVDALNIIAFEDEKGATRLLNRALQYGVKFSGENLAEIVDLCAEESFKKALYQSADAFTAQELFWNNECEASRFISRALDAGVRFRDENLEELYGNVSDDIIIQVAKAQNLKLPEDLREEEETELEDLSFEIQSAIDAADYALGCLAQAQSALGSLNAELRSLQKNKSVQLKYSRLATVIDMWIDDGFWDALTHLQINKVQKRIKGAITQVETIKKELIAIYNKR